MFAFFSLLFYASSLLPFFPFFLSFLPSTSSSSFFVCLHFFTSLTTIYSQANIRRARARVLAVAAWQVNTHDNTHLQYIYIYTCIISCSLFSPFCFTILPSFLSFLSFFHSSLLPTYLPPIRYHTTHGSHHTMRCYTTVYYAISYAHTYVQYIYMTLVSFCILSFCSLTHYLFLSHYLVTVTLYILYIYI